MSKNLSPAVTLTRDQKERRLAAAQELLEGEKTQTQIAEDNGVTPGAVSRWKSTLEEEGIEGLKSITDEGNQGPDSALDEQDREQLVEFLEGRTQAHGWETDLWTSKRVGTLIEQEFDIDYTPPALRALLAISSLPLPVCNTNGRRGWCSLTISKSSRPSIFGIS